MVLEYDLCSVIRSMIDLILKIISFFFKSSKVMVKTDDKNLHFEK